MILCDTGVLLTFAVGKREAFERLSKLIGSRKDALLTMDTCVDEASHLSHKWYGWLVQRRILQLVVQHTVQIHPITSRDWAHILDLMEKYNDLPMDLADATLVVLAERESLSDVLTMDRDFLIYRKRDGSAFNILNQLD